MSAARPADATPSVAMGAAGSHATLETADVVLMADDLARLPGLIRLGRRTRGTITANNTTTRPMTDCPITRPAISTADTSVSTPATTCASGPVNPALNETASAAYGCSSGTETAAPATRASSAATDAACQPAGHVNQGRAYQGRSAARRTARITDGSSVCGARGSGSAFNPRSMERSRSVRFMMGHVMFQGLTTPVDIGLDLAQ